MSRTIGAVGIFAPGTQAQPGKIGMQIHDGGDDDTCRCATFLTQQDAAAIAVELAERLSPPALIDVASSVVAHLIERLEDCHQAKDGLEWPHCLETQLLYDETSKAGTEARRTRDLLKRLQERAR